MILKILLASILEMDGASVGGVRPARMDSRATLVFKDRAALSGCPKAAARVRLAPRFTSCPRGLFVFGEADSSVLQGYVNRRAPRIDLFLSPLP